MKKSNVISIIFIILFIIFIYYYFQPTKYAKHYLIDDYKIQEKYDNGYSFKITKDDYNFDLVITKKYNPQRGLIKTIDEYKEGNYYCIYPVIKEENTKPLCYDKQQLIDFRLIDNQKFTHFLYNKYDNQVAYINKSLDNYNLYYNQSSIYAIWNYQGIDYIKEDELKRIKLFSKDYYDNMLMGLAGSYLFIPNYEQDHSFNEAYIINLKTGDYKTWKLPTSINYESYIVGSLSNKIYIVDKKEEKEYELDLLKQELLTISTEDGMGKIYDNGFKEITMNKLVLNKHFFKKANNYEFIIDNKQLFIKDLELNTTTKISNIVDPYIVNSDNDQVFYLKNDILYSYNLKWGEVKIMKNEEWNFNYINKIFIFDQK